MDAITIIKRPKADDGEEELFQMQEEFLKSRQQPSAKVINLRAQHKQTNESISMLPESEKSNTKFRSKFAERRSRKEEEKCVTTSQSSGDIINPDVSKDILHENCRKETLPDVVQSIPDDFSSRIILGNIVEKKFNDRGIELCKKFINVSSDTSGFPDVFVVDQKESANNSESLFHQSILTKSQMAPECLADVAKSNVQSINFEKSFIVEGSLGLEIHKSNIEKINQMTPEEIQNEKIRLENTLDPNIIKYLRNRRQSKMQSKTSTSICNESKTINEVDIHESKSEFNNENQPHTSMDYSSSIKTFDDDATLICSNNMKMECDITTIEPPSPVTEIIHEATDKGWIHMDEVETPKLEWMKDIPKKENNELAPDQPYNARFDFNGILLPFNDPNLPIDKGLHHHGEEPERPGYSLQELLQLSRSSTQQQRCTALTTLGNIMENSRKGLYDKVLDPQPLVALSQRNILLLLRFSLDDTSVAVVTATLQALRSFLYSEADEICLDRLCGWEYIDGLCLVPELLPPETDVNDISELKDHELAQLDCVAAAMRSDIVLRIRYILSEMRPPPVAVTFAIEILIRLARHSRITALNISTMPRLLEILIHNFIPLTTDHIVRDDNNKSYGIPNVTAVRLCRILVEYVGRPVAERLNNLKIMHPLISYISSNTNEAGLPLSIEALRLWRLLLIHKIAQESLDGAKLILNSRLRLLLSNHDLSSASELSCEYAASLVNVSIYESTLKPIISTLLTKWSTQLADISSPTWSKTKLLAVTLKALGDISALKIHWISSGNIFTNICSTSNLLCGFTLATERNPSCLPSLGVVLQNGELQPAVSINSCIPFLATLCNSFAKPSLRNELSTMFLHPIIVTYFRHLVNSNWSLENSWYTRAELFLVTAIVRVATEIDTNDLMKELLLKIAIKLIPTLPSDATQSVKEVLAVVLSSEKLTIESLSNNLCALELNSNDRKISLELPNNIIGIYEEYLSPTGNWNQSALPQDWPYLPLVAAYSNHKNKIELRERDIMKIIVSLSLEVAMPDIFHGLTPSLRFTRIILVYLCDTIYLDEKISALLIKAFTNLVKKYYKRLDFSINLPGLTSFTDLFTAMCECFCANSYGSDDFAAALLVPIAQRHDTHYRKLLWSEHAATLRYLRLSPEKMVIPLSEYLTPLEKDVSLIEYYITALIRGTVKKDWCPVMYIIAMHHSAMFLRGDSKLVTRMRSSIASIQDINLAENLLNYVSTYG
ncbi:hypothetical protein PV328_000696 [Microctonus aethiopoides]|uniref:RNA polymerase II-associated protein 1 n=1 Tax=Microctonus aethiopoides TaxID=144406 RepID=A0AA39KWT3_9HYME|nr:hypothetical protein PV328_000696 [Microctonus aethiopoides]